MICRLCNSNEDKTILESLDKRMFYLCPVCNLIFCNTDQFPTLKEEEKRYLEHENSPDNEGYRKFLSRAINPLLEFIDPKMHGLDYGCGPVPVTSIILKENNIKCFNYDPIFFPEIITNKFDFIIATECIEHFHYPYKEISNILELLKPKGFLAIMTEFWTDRSMFKNWYYSRDNTHVSFYHRNTMVYICEKFKFKIKYHDSKRVMILQYKS